MIEVILVILGGLVLTAGYLIPAKKEHKGEQQIGEEQVREIVEKEMGGAKEQLSDIVDETITYAMEKTERAMERLSNEKIMAIEEYSGTVMTDISKNHEEVVFLYDMLNDKHETLKTTVSEANKTEAEVKQTLKDAEITAKEAKETLKVAEEKAQGALQSASGQSEAISGTVEQGSFMQSASVQGNAFQGSAVQTPTWQHIDRSQVVPSASEWQGTSGTTSELDPQERLARVREEMQRMEMVAATVPEPGAETRSEEGTAAKTEEPVDTIASGLADQAESSTKQQGTILQEEASVLAEGVEPNALEEVSTGAIPSEEADFKPLEVSRVKVIEEEPAPEKKAPAKKTSARSRKKTPAKESATQDLATKDLAALENEGVEDFAAISEPKAKQEVQPPVLRTKTEEELAKADARAENVEIQFRGNRGGRNNNDRILELHQAGKSNMAIAKELGLGIGEVKLVIDLFKGAKK